MAWYKHNQFLQQSQDAAFDALHNPGVQAPVAGVYRCHGCGREIGIAFEIDRSLEPRRAADAELQQRVETLETEIAALKRLVARLKAKVFPHDLDVA